DPAAFRHRLTGLDDALARRHPVFRVDAAHAAAAIGKEHARSHNGRDTHNAPTPDKPATAPHKPHRPAWQPLMRPSHNTAQNDRNEGKRVLVVNKWFNWL